ncbi:MAG: hypothetical protein RBS24_05900 [Bacilli bacterium]|nr:hypothetical protein [Bacilli bacterium]MDY0338608.1 hypothetical protein [Acholeplasmataceae bacterium]
MKKVKVIITKLAGETGLRKPGTTLLMYPKEAKSLEARGFVEIEKPKKKKKKSGK